MRELIDQAIAHHRAGRFVDASHICRQILAENPSDADALRIMGLLARRAGNLELSLQLLQKAVQFSPQNLDALIQLGDLLTNLENFSQAEAMHRRFIALAPGSAMGWTNLGNVLRLQGKMEEALAAYQAAIRADPNFAAAFSNLGNLLKDLGKIDEAINAFRQAVDLDPTSPQMHSNLVYATHFSTEYDSQQLGAEARAWAERHEKPLLNSHRPHDNPPNSASRLKIGYVSSDFRNHVVGRNVLPILENHDHQSFEIHCFSSLPRHDAMTSRFIRAADHWHECGGLDDAMLAETIRAKQIDILVDLTLHMSGNRLQTFARKPAPIQVTWAGYPGTTGLSSIDFRITDPYLDPPEAVDSFYTEKSIHLPHSFWCYRPIDGVPEVNSSPAISNGFITFGCLNHFGKVTKQARDLWSQVLNAVPNSRLILLGSPCQKTLDGIDPARISFVGLTAPDQHMIRYHQIDIALDPLPYTGHTTTLDALWMGVPVITLSRNTCVSRGSVTALSNLALENLIAFTPDQYVTIATELARDLQRISEIRSQLRKRMRSSPLCDEVVFTRDLENGYRKMVKLHATDESLHNGGHGGQF